MGGPWVRIRNDAGYVNLETGRALFVNEDSGAFRVECNGQQAEGSFSTRADCLDAIRDLVNGRDIGDLD